VKFSGIAAGKGVVVATSIAEADAAIEQMLEARIFGDSAEVLVEEYMEGEELSFFALTDGTNVIPMLAAQDHKRIGEGDTGPNTGGMGAYAPVSLATPALVQTAVQRIVTPTLKAMRDAGCTFTGLLYTGLMLTPQGPKVVEFNCRFGDPETQAILPLLSASLLVPIQAIAEGGTLRSVANFGWQPRSAVTTVVAAAGYPATPRLGDPIALPAERDDVMIFHAGTARNASGDLVTSGGRVLAVTAVADTMQAAQALSRDTAAEVEFAGRQLRRDIGYREIARSA
jgi:phosphoribosylamine--glycine ligase